MTTFLAILAAFLTLICVIPYIRDVRRGTTLPHRTTWFVFASLSVVAAAAQLTDNPRAGGGLLAAGAAVGFTAVFVLSLRHGVGGGSIQDIAALCVAAVGVVLWLATSRPVLAIAGVIVAEAGAGAVTVAKAYRTPRSETLATWVIDGFAGVVALISLQTLTDVSEIAYPIHHVLLNGAVAVAVLLGRRRNSA